MKHHQVRVWDTWHGTIEVTSKTKQTASSDDSITYHMKDISNPDIAQRTDYCSYWLLFLRGRSLGMYSPANLEEIVCLKDLLEILEPTLCLEGGQGCDPRLLGFFRFSCKMLSSTSR